ncbi:M56 family metallopeptidase [Colidextribacter sp. OB.20]|uniref:M56 family metallopeptidase n=2 Tax=Eubacteriales TaxID=186802 RepID=UPI001FAE6A93|nr:M56 family metallopeptidase [Colidextribacter sp. OB.20]
MNAVLKIFLSMSFSGSLLILALLFGKQFLKNKISRQWQYYIWLVVVLRLLLPFGTEVSLMGKAYQAVDQAISQTAPLPPQQQLPLNAPESNLAPAVGAEHHNETVSSPADDVTTAHPLQDIGVLLINQIWLVWLVAALGLLIRKITIYQGFMRYIKAGLTPVSDIERLDELSIVAEQSGIKKPIELCVNPLVSSPLLIGFFRPCIVLPSADIPEKDFRYIILHELTHYKRRDMFYKWLVQITVCLHWFNPLVYLMSLEITKACEFSCDEAVLAKMGSGNAQDYGKTLLDAMAAVGRYKENLGAVTLSENKQLLKERLGAIMSFKKASKAIRLLTGMLTLCIIFSAAFVGIYSTAAAADVPNSIHADNSLEMETLDFKGTSYYLVYNEAQLRAIGTGKYGMNLNYMQQADISLSAGDWVPIGTWDVPFTGTYNGNGFEITGLTMTDPDAEIIGLFGVAKNAHIYNITLRDYDIASAGKNATNKSVGAVLAIGQGSRSYDNFVYPKEAGASIEDNSSEIERYYKADSLPLFEITFPRLDENAQRIWLEKLYAESDFAFFSVAVRRLGSNSPLLADFAEKAYTDEEMAFFSTLTDCMDKAELELWLDRALEDGNWAFQSMLFDKLNRSEEFDELEEKQQKEWAEAQMAEYEKAGVTMVDEKTYYYQGQLVNIFLDIRKEGSFYTLNMNPKGTVNIKIVRDAKNKITGVSYMTEAEVIELLRDMDDPDDKTGVAIIPVDFKTVAAGETIFLGEYTLSDGDEILYDISAKTGNRMKVFFAKDNQEDVAYWSVNNLRQPGEPLECIADFTVGPPATTPGTYKLYLQAPDGALGTVRGSVSIVSADAS